jgi:hypothetical protein
MEPVRGTGPARIRAMPRPPLSKKLVGRRNAASVARFQDNGVASSTPIFDREPKAASRAPGLRDYAENPSRVAVITAITEAQRWVKVQLGNTTRLSVLWLWDACGSRPPSSLALSFRDLRPHRGHPHEGTTNAGHLMMRGWCRPRDANAHGVRRRQRYPLFRDS